MQVVQAHGDEFHRRPKHFAPATMEEMSDSRFANDQTFAKGCKVECVGGTNCGLAGYVAKICPKMIMFHVVGKEKDTPSQQKICESTCTR